MTTILLYILIPLNLAAYVASYVDWKKDCRKFGKDNLGVSLTERWWAIMLCITFPSVLGLLLRKGE